MSTVDQLSQGAVLLAPDNFTSVQQTPWAGDRIAKLFKDQILPKARGTKIGESWEFSCAPSQPSKLVEASTATLIDFIEQNPKSVLGPKQVNDGCQILVKLLNASQPLSLQVHPSDDDPSLKPDECGKPESWLILDVEPGAGLYLGFAKKISRKDFAAALDRGDNIESMLNFVPVKAGDYFEIEPGVPHAIGPGITLLEPQRLMKGKNGKTYRIWDWGRKRETHVKEALPLIDPENQVGNAFVEQTRRLPEITQPKDGITWTSYPKNPYYQLHMFEFSKQATTNLKIEDGYGALIMLGGKISLTGRNHKTQMLNKGQPALLPFDAQSFRLAGEAGSRFALVIPAASCLAC